MSFRGGPKTLDEVVAYLEERLRNLHDLSRFRGDVNMGSDLAVDGTLTVPTIVGGLALGTVEKINWPTDWGTPPTVDVLLDDGTTVTARCTEFPPPPRSRAILWLGGDGTWRHMKVDGGRRLILFDDFTDAALVAATRGYGDTIWRQRGTLGGVAPVYAPPSQGVVQLASDATGGNNMTIAKGDLTVVAADTLWFSARARLPSVGNSLTSLLTGIGLASDDLQTFNVAPGAGDTAVSAQWQDGVASGNWTLRTTNQAIANVVTDTGVAAVLDTWLHFDIEHSPTAGWAAMWINGVGPTVVTGTSLPPGTSGFNVFATIYPLIASTRRLDVDWIRLEQFPYAVSPV